MKHGQIKTILSSVRPGGTSQILFKNMHESIVMLSRAHTRAFCSAKCHSWQRAGNSRLPWFFFVFLFMTGDTNTFNKWTIFFQEWRSPLCLRWNWRSKLTITQQSACVSATVNENNMAEMVRDSYEECISEELLLLLLLMRQLRRPVAV